MEALWLLYLIELFMFDSAYDGITLLDGILHDFDPALCTRIHGSYIPLLCVHNVIQV